MAQTIVNYPAWVSAVEALCRLCASSFPLGGMVNCGRRPAYWMDLRAIRILGQMPESARLAETGRAAHPELTWRNADEALEVAGELALVVEPGSRCDLGQGGVGLCSQEVLGSLDAARDHI